MSRQLAERNQIISSLEETLEQFVSEASGLRRERAEQGKSVYELETKISELSGKAVKAKALQKAASNAIIDRDAARNMADEHKQLALRLEDELSRLKSENNPVSTKRVLELETSAKAAEVSFRNQLAKAEKSNQQLKEELEKVRNEAAANTSKQDAEALSTMRQHRDQLSTRVAAMDNDIIEIETERDVAQARHNCSVQEKHRILSIVDSMAGEVLNGDRKEMKLESMKSNDVEEIVKGVTSKIQEGIDHVRGKDNELAECEERARQLEVKIDLLEKDLRSSKSDSEGLHKSELQKHADELESVEQKVKNLERDLRESRDQLTSSQNTVKELRQAAEEEKERMSKLAHENDSSLSKQIDEAMNTLSDEKKESLRLKDESERLKQLYDDAEIQRKRDLECAVEIHEVIQVASKPHLIHLTEKIEQGNAPDFETVAVLVRGIVEEYESVLPVLEASRMKCRSLEASSESLQRELSQTKSDLEKLSNDANETKKAREVLSEELSGTKELLEKQNLDRRKELLAVQSDGNNAVTELQRELDRTSDKLKLANKSLTEQGKLRDDLSKELFAAKELLEKQSADRREELLAVQSDGNNAVAELQEGIDEMNDELQIANRNLAAQGKLRDDLYKELFVAKELLEKQSMDKEKELLAVQSDGKNAVNQLQREIDRLNDELKQEKYGLTEQETLRDSLSEQLREAKELLETQSIDRQSEISTIRSDTKSLILELQEEIDRANGELKEAKKTLKEQVKEKDSLSEQLTGMQIQLKKQTEDTQKELLAAQAEGSSSAVVLQGEIDRSNGELRRANVALSEQEKIRDSLSEQLGDAKLLLKRKGKGLEMDLTTARSEKEKLSLELQSRIREIDSLQESLELLCRFLDTRKRTNDGVVSTQSEEIPRSVQKEYAFDSPDQYVSHIRQQLKIQAVEVESIEEAMSLEKLSRQTAEEEAEKNMKECERLQVVLVRNQEQVERQMKDLMEISVSLVSNEEKIPRSMQQEYAFDSPGQYVSHIRQQLKLQAVEVESIEEAMSVEKLGRQKAEKEAEKNMKECERLQVVLARNEEQVEGQMKELTEITASLISKEEELQDLTVQLADLSYEKMVRQSAESEVEKARDVCNRLEQEKLQVESQLKELREVSTHLKVKEAELRALSLQLSCAVDELENEKSRIRALTDESKQQSIKLSCLEQDKKILEKKCNDLQGEADILRHRFESDLEGSSSRHADLEKKNISLESKCSRLASELALVRGTFSGQEQQLNERNSKIEEENEKLRIRLSVLSEEITAAGNFIAAIEDERSTVILELHRANEQMEGMLGQAEKFVSKLRSLESEAITREDDIAVSAKESNHLRKQLTDIRTQLKILSASKDRAERELLEARSEKGDVATQMARELEFFRSQDDENKLCVIELIERANALCLITNKEQKEKQQAIRRAEKMTSELSEAEDSFRRYEDENQVLLHGKKKAETELLCFLSQNQKLASELELRQLECTEKVSSKEDLDGKFTEVSEELSSCRLKIDEYHTQQQAQLESVAVLTKKNANLTQQVSNLGRDYAVACQETKDVEQKLTVLEGRLAESGREYERAVKDHESATGQLQETSAQHGQAVADLEKESAARRLNSEALEETERKFAEMQDELQLCRTEIERMRRTEQVARGTVGEAATAQQRLEAELLETKQSYENARSSERDTAKQLSALTTELSESRNAYERAMVKSQSNGEAADQRAIELSSEIQRLSVENAELAGEVEGASAKYQQAVADYERERAAGQLKSQALEEAKTQFALTKDELTVCRSEIEIVLKAEQEATRAVDEAVSAKQKLEAELLKCKESYEKAIIAQRNTDAKLVALAIELEECSHEYEGAMEKENAIGDVGQREVELSSKIRSLNTENDKLAILKQEIADEVAELSKFQSSLSEENASLREKLMISLSEKEVLEKTNNQLSKVRESLFFEVVDLEEQLVELVESSSAATEQLAEAEKKLAASERVVHSQKAHAADMARSCKELEEQIAGLGRAEGEIRLALDKFDKSRSPYYDNAGTIVTMELLTPCSTSTSTSTMFSDYPQISANDAEPTPFFDSNMYAEAEADAPSANLARVLRLQKRCSEAENAARAVKTGSLRYAGNSARPRRGPDTDADANLLSSVAAQLEKLRHCESDASLLRKEIENLQAGEMQMEAGTRPAAERRRREEQALREIMEVLEAEAEAATERGAPDAAGGDGDVDEAVGNSAAGDSMLVSERPVVKKPPLLLVKKPPPPLLQAPVKKTPPPLAQAPVKKPPPPLVQAPRQAQALEKEAQPVQDSDEYRRREMEKVVNPDRSWISK